MRRPDVAAGNSPCRAGAENQHYSRTAPPARSSRCGRRPAAGICRSPFSPPFPTISWLNPPSASPSSPSTRPRGSRSLPAALSFADDVVVIDGGSTDDTVAIAQAHGARVIVERDWPGFGPQKNRALDALDTDWILSSIPTKSSPRNSRNRSATRSARRPRRSMRSTACRASAASGSITAAGIRTGSRACSGAAPRASRTISCTSASCSTAPRSLSGKLMHYSYEDFETVVRKLDAYSTAGARQRAAGQRGGFGKALARGAWAFVRTYVLRRGFLDGRAGFMIAVFNAETVYYRFLKLGHERPLSARPAGSRPGVTMPGCPRRACPPDRRRHAPPATTTTESDRHVLHHHSDLEQPAVPQARRRQPAPPLGVRPPDHRARERRLGRHARLGAQRRDRAHRVADQHRHLPRGELGRRARHARLRRLHERRHVLLPRLGHGARAPHRTDADRPLHAVGHDGRAGRHAQPVRRGQQFRPRRRTFRRGGPRRGGSEARAGGLAGNRPGRRRSCTATGGTGSAATAASCRPA